MHNKDHPISLGCSALGGLYAPMSEENAARLLQCAWDHGIRYFDTAPHYGNGMSEQRLGQFLRDKQGFAISTKVGRVLSPIERAIVPTNGFHSLLPNVQAFDYSYDGIMRAVEGSLTRLGVAKFDTLYVHDIGDKGVGTDTPTHMNALIGGGQRALSQLKREGVTKNIGLGVNTVEVCEALIGEMEIDTILLAGRYTLLDRTAASKLLPLCRAHCIQIVIGGVFNSGILATGATENSMFDYAPASVDVKQRVREIESLCAAYNVPLAAVALQFPARNDCIVSTLIGTSKSTSLTRNLALLDVKIPEKLWNEIEEIGVALTVS